ncbi:MAG: hypothetical protein ABR529_15700 [Actinomycetota bacterium]
MNREGENREGENREGNERSALLVGGDLMARARLEAAASAAGVALHTASPEGLGEALRAAPARWLILDLDQGRRAALDALVRARADGLVPERVVGYFSHVDEELGRAARAAGCEALPRGRFWRTLPELFGAP